MNQPLKLLLDEHVWEGLSERLSARGYDVLHVTHTPHRGMDDEALLSFAASEGRALLTYNIRHFVPIAVRWYEANDQHAGIILSSQLLPGELMRRVEDLLSTLGADEIRNTVRWL